MHVQKALSLKERYIPDKRDKEVTMTRQRIHGMYLVCFNYSYNLSTQALKNYNEIHILL